MRILHVIYDDLGNPWLGGGGAVRTLEIYRRIAAKGPSVTVICGNYPGAKRREMREGIRYRRVGLSEGYVLSRLTFVARAARLIKHGGYDIVIEDVSPFSPVASPLWTARGVPVVASVQNLSGAHASAKYGLAGWGPRLVEKPLLSLFTNFIAVSPGIAGQLRRAASRPGNLRVIPNSVSPIFFENSEPEPPAQPPYILFLGRIDVYQKGLDRLIRDFDLFASRVPGVELYIAGGGSSSQVAKLTRLAGASGFAGRIRLLGPVAPAQAAELMRGALLLAMPSRYEAWPLTALEAGAAGLPVVGSDIVGVRDAAPAFPKGHALLVPEGNTEEYAAALERLATDGMLREKLGEKGREWASGFTWDALAEQQLAFYMDLTRQKPAQSGKKGI